MPGQSIRPSQFITTYGPGAILEGADGPCVIVSLDLADLFNTARPASYFDITYPRLSDALLGGAGIIRIPTNAELGIPDSTPIYITHPFPAWSLCELPGHQILYRAQFGATSGCPRCPGGSQGQIWAKARREAIRFVRACPEGHLDDVDWVGIVRHSRPNCRPQYLEWTGHGGALRNIEIQCPDCLGRVNLGQAYARDWPCAGRLPETRQQPPGPCSRGPNPAKILQRGAANLRVPELLTAITIFPGDTPLHRVLSRPSTKAVLLVRPPANKHVVLTALGKLVQARLIPPSDPTEVERYSNAEVMAAVNDIQAGTGPATAGTLRDEEFSELQRAATQGAPAVAARTPDRPPVFEVIRNDVRTVAGPGGTLLRVTPVSRLQVTMVQRGYRRVVLDNPFQCAEVSTAFNDGQRDWYPGVELFGEGIFIDLAPPDEGPPRTHPALGGAEASDWLRAWNNPDSFGRRLADQDKLHPLFVWWHTLAHRLITALAVDSGYSSASVRERVYAHIDAATGQARGGLLLYTAQPGGDGTLGGLMSLVPGFAWVLERAFQDMDVCSNDPLCGEERFAPGRYNGAACYACLLVSETSCEFRNTSLDRNLLRNNLP